MDCEVELYATVHDATPRVIPDGDNAYMGSDGTTYMVIEDPKNVDKFGIPKPRNGPTVGADVPPVFQDGVEQVLVLSF